MSKQSGSASETESPWSGTSSEPPFALSGTPSDNLRLFWSALAEADKHLARLDSLASLQAGEIESYASTAILTASKEQR